MVTDEMIDKRILLEKSARHIFDSLFSKIHLCKSCHQEKGAKGGCCVNRWFNYPPEFSTNDPALVQDVAMVHSIRDKHYPDWRSIQDTGNKWCRYLSEKGCMFEIGKSYTCLIKNCGYMELLLSKSETAMRIIKEVKEKSNSQITPMSLLSYAIREDELRDAYQVESELGKYARNRIETCLPQISDEIQSSFSGNLQDGMIIKNQLEGD